jgi:hypothetical protein
LRLCVSHSNTERGTDALELCERLGIQVVRPGELAHALFEAGKVEEAGEVTAVTPASVPDGHGLSLGSRPVTAVAAGSSGR